MKNPIIGITVDEGSESTYSKFPWYAIRKNYSESIDQAGGISIFLPQNIEKISDYLNIIDALIITGGDFDIDPKFYGQKINSSKIKLKEDRTFFEYEIAKKAIKINLPISGICGGQQLLNVVLGGSLIQHIPDTLQTTINHEQKNPRNEASHKVIIKKGTKLYKITQVDSMYVNSAHHQAVDKLGEGLKANSYTEDGLIEGFEHQSLNFCLGIQWHPEFLIDNKDIEIFKALVENSRSKN